MRKHLKHFQRYADHMSKQATNRIRSRKSQVKGAALLIFVLFFTFSSLALMIMVGDTAFKAVTQYQRLFASKQALFMAESLGEDVTYRILEAMNFDSVESIEFYGARATTTTTIDFTTDEFVVVSQGGVSNSERFSEILLSVGTGASFNFGLQTGNGGIHMDNNSSVQGNVFSNGPVTGSNSATVYGDVISAGPSGYVGGFYATSSVWANEIEDMDIDGDAYYTTLSGSNTILGTSYGSQPDQATATLPISDEAVATWQSNIETGGTVIASTSPECASSTPGLYVIDSDITIGDVIIECDLEIQKNGTDVTLTGPIWVKGNITFDQGPSIVIDSAVGARSVQMIADNPDNRTTSSQIVLNNSTSFAGSGSPKSYVLLLSMNEDAENGGLEDAVTLTQSAKGDVLVYAAHGRVSMGNNISLKEVTGYQIDISNGSEVIYESGLVNLLFTSGPGGGFSIVGWEEK